MSSILRAVKDKPLSLFAMDTSTNPDYSGYGKTATATSPTFGPAIAAGSLNSMVLNNSRVCTYTSSVFNQGQESQPFTLEAWARPVQKTTNQNINYNAPYTNLVQNPLPMNTTNWSLTNTGTGGVGTATWDGTNQAIITTVTTQPTSSAWTVRYGNGPTTDVNVVPGQRYYFSVEVNSSIQDYRALGADWRDANNVALPLNDIPRVSLPPNTWVKLEGWWTAPANATLVSGPLVYAGTSGTAAVIRTLGSTLSVRRAMCVPVSSDIAIPYFDGNTAGYEWNGQTHFSITTPTTYTGLRTNLVTNPSFETGITGWQNYGAGVTRTQSSAQRYSGLWSQLATSTATGAQGIASVDIAITAGKQYAVSGFINTVNTTTSNNIYINYFWRDAINGTQVGTTQTISSVALGSTVGWGRAGIITQAAPAGAAALQIRFYMAGAAIGDAFYLDGVLVEEATAIRDYFDGSFTGGTWTGTANGSTSTMAPHSTRNLVWNGEPSGTKVNSTNVFRQNLAWTDSSLPTTVGSTGTLTTGVSADGVTWTRWTGNGAVNPVIRKLVALSQLSNGGTYTASWEIYNDSAAPITLSVDWCDQNATSYTIAAGQRRVISCTASKNPYDTTYRFTDLNMNPAGSTESFLFREIQVELGSAYNPYFDGGLGAANINWAKGQSAGVYRASDNATVQSPSTSGPITNDSAPTSALSGTGYMSGSGAGLEYAQVDLGSIKYIDTIKVWHYWSDSRIYNATKLQVSVDGTTWTTVFDSATSGTYAESSAGRTTTFTSQPVRYIRDFANGSSANAGNHWEDIKAYDTSGIFVASWSGTAFASNSFMLGVEYPNALFSTSVAYGTVVGLVENLDSFNRFITPANGAPTSYRIIQIRGSFNEINPGDTITIQFKARAGGGWSSGFTTSTITLANGANLNGIGATASGVTLTSSWQTFTRTIVAATKPGTDALFYMHTQNITSTQDSWVDMQDLIISTDAVTDFFDGDNVGARWDSTAYGSGSVMLPSTMEQQILGNQNQMDGLTMNGTVVSFVTKYLNTGEARASYDVQVPQAIHVVGTHAGNRNQLYVNGQLVATADISAAQQADTYVATNTNLYTGATYSSTEMLVNNVATYAGQLSSQVIADHYTQGVRTVSVNDIAPRYGGYSFPLTQEENQAFISNEWKTSAEWGTGVLTNTVVLNERIQPALSAGISLAGNWITAIPLDSRFTSVYGVNLDWDGQGVLVEASLDGTTWETAIRGQNLALLAVNSNPNGKLLRIRASFTGGVLNDPSYLDSLTLVGLISNVIDAPETTTGTMFLSVSPKHLTQPIYLNDNWGADFNQGYLSILASAADVPFVPKTVEIWYKVDQPSSYRLVDGRFSGTTRLVIGSGAGDIAGAQEAIYLINFTTARKNNLPVVNGDPIRTGEWQCVIASTSNPEGIDGRIFINNYAFAGSSNAFTGFVTVGRLAFYDTALTAAQMGEIYTANTGVPKQVIADTSGITVTKSSTATNPYMQDWMIVGGG